MHVKEEQAKFRSSGRRRPPTTPNPVSADEADKPMTNPVGAHEGSHGGQR